MARTLFIWNTPYGKVRLTGLGVTPDLLACLECHALSGVAFFVIVTHGLHAPPYGGNHSLNFAPEKKKGYKK
jgi:hypothetical protein